jgi:hypothetical protein
MPLLTNYILTLLKYFKVAYLERQYQYYEEITI